MSRGATAGREAERPADEHEEPILEADQVPRCTNSQIPQARKPLRWTPLMSATAAARPIVASSPLLRNETGRGRALQAERGRGRPRTGPAASQPVRCRAADQLAARITHADHVADRDYLRVPGESEIGSTVTRPARSRSAPVSSASLPARLDAVTPAAQTTARLAMRSASVSPPSSVTPAASIPITVRPVRTVTPRRWSDRSAFAESEGGSSSGPGPRPRQGGRVHDGDRSCGSHAAVCPAPTRRSGLPSRHP